MLDRLTDKTTSAQVGDFLVQCIESKIHNGVFDRVSFSSRQSDKEMREREDAMREIEVALQASGVSEEQRREHIEFLKQQGVNYDAYMEWKSRSKPCTDEFYDWNRDKYGGSYGSGRPNFITITRVPRGSAGEYIEDIEQTIRKYGMASIPTTLAPVYLYHRNPSASPSANDCTDMDGGQINCLSHTIEMISHDGSPATIAVALNAVAPMLGISGCKFRHHHLSEENRRIIKDINPERIDPYITCLNKVIAELPYNVNEVIFSPYVNMDSPCILSPYISSEIEKGEMNSSNYIRGEHINYVVPCIQYIFDDLEGGADYEEGAALGQITDNPMLYPLMNQSIFQVGGKYPVTGIQYLLEGRARARFKDEVILRAISGGGVSCIDPNSGSPQSCVDRLLDRAVEISDPNSPARSSNLTAMLAILSRSQEFIDSAIWSRDCFDGDGNRIQCIDKIISMQPKTLGHAGDIYVGVASNHKNYPIIAFKEILYRASGRVDHYIQDDERGEDPAPSILGKDYEDTLYWRYPQLDIAGATCRYEGRSVSCLDKAISNPLDAMIITSTPFDVDKNVCTDDKGTSLNCLDKIISLYDFGLGFNEKVEKWGKLCNEYRGKPDREYYCDHYLALIKAQETKYSHYQMGMGRLSNDVYNGKYNVIGMKCHGLDSKSDEEFAVDRESKTSCIDRIVDIAEKEEPSLSRPHPAELFNLDNIIKSDMNLKGAMCTIKSDQKTWEVPCLQKVISAAMANDVRAHRRSNLLGIVMTRADMYDPVCVRRNGERISCNVHIIEESSREYNISPDSIITPEIAASIVLAGKMKALPESFVGSDGKEHKTRDLICGNITMTSAMDAIKKREAAKPTFGVGAHGHKTLDGMALRMVTNCQCGEKSPREQRECADDICFNKYSRKYDYVDEWMHISSLYREGNDALGIAGVYGVTSNKPDEDVVKKYNKGVEDFYPDIRMKFIRTTKYKGKDVVTSPTLIYPDVMIPGTTIPDTSRSDYKIQIDYIDAGAPREPEIRTIYWVPNTEPDDISDEFNPREPTSEERAVLRQFHPRGTVLDVSEGEFRPHTTSAAGVPVSEEDVRDGGGTLAVWHIQMQESLGGEILGSSTYNFSSILSDKVLKAFPDFAKFMSERGTAVQEFLPGAVKSKPTAKEQKFEITVSRRPADFLRASTCQNWASCMNLNTQGVEHRGHILNAYDHGSYIAYIAENEMSTNWLGRSWVHVVHPNPENEDAKCAMRQPFYGLSQYKKIFENAVDMIFAMDRVNTEACLGAAFQGRGVGLAVVTSNDFAWKNWQAEQREVLEKICERFTDEKVTKFFADWDAEHPDAEPRHRETAMNIVRDIGGHDCKPATDRGENAINSAYRKYTDPGDLRKLKYEVWLDQPNDRINILPALRSDMLKMEYGENFVVKLRPVTQW